VHFDFTYTDAKQQDEQIGTIDLTLINIPDILNKKDVKLREEIKPKFGKVAPWFMQT
jgi:hypothetical protein